MSVRVHNEVSQLHGKNFVHMQMPKMSTPIYLILYIYLIFLFLEIIILAVMDKINANPVTAKISVHVD